MTLELPLQQSSGIGSTIPTGNNNIARSTSTCIQYSGSLTGDACMIPDNDSVLQAALATAAALAAASAQTVTSHQQITLQPNCQSSIPLSFSPVIYQPNLSNSQGVQSMKVRRGKWTQEEESYADYLIEHFEKGTVDGCENGCTLRAFLSRKLYCAPMRISKKYAGKSSFCKGHQSMTTPCLQAIPHTTSFSHLQGKVLGNAYFCQRAMAPML